MPSTRKNSLLLILAAFIWGVAFVAQSTGGDAVGAFSFNWIRWVIASVVLLPVIAWFDRRTGAPLAPHTREEKKCLLMAGILTGTALFLASNLQQVGITMGTPAGKAGFLTSIYIVLVPVLGIFLNRRCSWNVWLSVFLSLVGLYLLCMSGGLTVSATDLILLLCALCFSVQILVIDHFAGRVDPVRLSCLEFLVCSILTLIPTVFYDIPSSGGLGPWLRLFLVPSAWISILYAGVCSSGIAYTLQIIGQQNLHPAVASVLMSLESVFSVLAGWVLLHEVLSGRELLGCGVIFAAVLLAQLPMGSPDLSRDESKA